VGKRRKPQKISKKNVSQHTVSTPYLKKQSKLFMS